MSHPEAGKRCWHVVYTKPKQESRALEQLQNQGYVCFLPTLAVEKPRRGKLDKTVEPLFARYLFIHFNPLAGDWSSIRSTRGVSRLVSFGDHLATIPDVLVEALQSAPQIIHRLLFRPGDEVAITRGPFAGVNGIYQSMDGEARALVLVELMSQPQKLKFAVEMLRKAA